MKVFLAILAPLLWGTTYAALSAYFQGWSPFCLAVWRALPAGFILLALKPTLPSKEELPALLLIGFLNIALFFGLLFASALQLPSTLVGVGMIALPVVALAVLGVAHQIKPSPVQKVTAVILVACAAFLFLTSEAPITLSSVLFLIGAMTALIAGSLVTKHVMKKIHWWKLLTWKLIFGGLILLPLAYWDYNFSGNSYVLPLPLSADQIVAMLWLVVGLTCIAYGAYVFTIPLITTTELSFFGTFNPILAMILGATIMGESFNSTQIDVMVLMVICNLVAQAYERKQKLPTEQAIIEY